MNSSELIEVVLRGEDSRHQFKVDFRNVDALAAEIVAFSNSGGGRIFIGVADDGRIQGLTPASVGRVNQLLSNAASQSVRPPVNVTTENVSIESGVVIVVSVPEGVSKPYMDSSGVIWIKNSADKRRATSREEIQRMFQSAGLVHADETLVPGSSLDDIDLKRLDQFLEASYSLTTPAESDRPRLLENMNLARGGVLNLAGVLLFASRPERRLPAFIVKAAAFPGLRVDDHEYIDSRDLSGNLAELFQHCISFVLANIRWLQGEQSVNSIGQPEVPRVVWEELIANALVHRDYFITAPIRLLVFSDRVEIISPGHLPNNLTVENIKAGNSNIRNPIIASYAAKLLPYRGLGSGILRALRAYPAIEFSDDRSGNLFRVTVARPVLPTMPARVD